MPDSHLFDSQNDTGMPEVKESGFILIIIMLLTVLDISVDLLQGIEIFHIVIEVAILPLAGLALYRLWRRFVILKEQNILLKTNMEKLTADAAQWKADAGKYVKGLANAIDAQLARWNLSSAEKEIALLLLKGLSHKEIAEIRKTSERTARQQSLAVYEKSGLGGRAELAAFFLEDLLTPEQY